MRRAVLLAAALLLAGARVEARELPPEVRRWAERAFLEGRLDDLDAILAGAEEALDRLPLLVRDRWWRVGAAQATPGVPADPVLARRLAWLEDPQGPYPGYDGGGEDPYPILTALVEDRVRRERTGKAGLPLEGPLEALADSGRLDERAEERSLYFLGTWTRQLMTSVYAGREPDEAEAAARARAQALRARNGLWAWLALGVFGALVAVLAGAGRLLGRRPARAP